MWTLGIQRNPVLFCSRNVDNLAVNIKCWIPYLECKYVSIHFSRGYSSPRRARPVGALPSSRAQCAMAARCPCFATASRIPSKPSSALPAMRTACSPVWAAATEDVKCLTQHLYFCLWDFSQDVQLDCSTGSKVKHSRSLPWPLLVREKTHL